MEVPSTCAKVVLALFAAFYLTEVTDGKVISFAAKSYTYFVNDDVHPGKELAVLKATTSPGVPSPQYTTTGGRYFTADFGHILLQKSLQNIPLGKDHTRRVSAVIKACTRSRRYCAETKLFVIALPRNYGDRLISEAKKHVTVRKLINRIFPKTKRGKMAVTPAQLLRLFRRITKETAKISMSGAKQDLLIDYIRKEIVNRLGIDGPGHLNFDCLHVEKLFSLEGIQLLLDSKTCRSAMEKNVDCYSQYHYRTYDGTCNNMHHHYWGAAGTKLERMLEAEYTDPDRFFLPKGSPDEFYKYGLPLVSQVARDFIHTQNHSRNSREPFSHALMQWGQFIDHDMDLSPESEGANKCSDVACNGSLQHSIQPCFPIIPVDNSSRCIMMTRSAAICQTDPLDIQPREQMNVLTAFIDGSQIYGSSEARAKELRVGKDGLLKMSKKNMMIQNHGDVDHPLDLCKNMGGCFLSGDTRVNEQIGLASMHTLFNREHNRIARKLKKINEHWKDEKLFQETRKIVGAILQKITYKDYLPKILGKDALLPFKFYQYDVNPGILNEFSTAAFRFGHSMIRPMFDMLDSGYNPVMSSIPLIKMFFNNVHIQKYGIEPILLGLLANVSQNVDPTLADGLTKHLFETPHSHGLDLAALNIQRGRDHGLSGYNAYREVCGLKTAHTFDDVANEIKNAERRKILEKLYKSPDKVDLWVAGLAEDPLPNAAVGPTFQCILKKQFKNLRDGDRFYFEEKDVFTRQQLREIKKVTLSHILCDNLKGIVSIQRDAFIAPTCKESRISCERILEYSMNLEAWKDFAPCFSNPCEHGGHCHPINGGRNYECICPPYWTGTRCEYRQHPCNPSPCSHPHEMICRSEMKGELFYCTCIPGLFQCRQLDFCKDGPCPFGYKCRNDHNIGYQCVRMITHKI